MNEYYDFFKDFAGVTEKDLQQYKCGGKAKKKACGGIKMKKMEDGSWFNRLNPFSKNKQNTDTKKPTTIKKSKPKVNTEQLDPYSKDPEMQKKVQKAYRDDPETQAEKEAFYSAYPKYDPSNRKRKK